MDFKPEDINNGGIPDPPKNKFFKPIDFNYSGTDSAKASFLGAGATNQFSFDDFRFQPKTNADNYKLRAQDQSGWEQLGITAANMIPNIAMGIVEAIGYIPELFDEAKDYDNGLIQLMQKGHNPFGEVYRENPNETFDFEDPAWWYTNVGQLVESIGEFAVPGALGAKLFGSLAKGASTAFKLGAIGDKVTRGAGMMATSAYLAYTEGAMSGNHVFKEIYNTQYKKLIKQGFDPNEAHDSAARLAGEGAASTVGINTAMNTVFNLAALAPLFRNSENKINQWFMREGARVEGESLSQWGKRISAAAIDSPELMKALKYRNGLTSPVANMIGEGIEEVNTQFAEQKGRQRGGLEVAKGINFLDDYFKKVGNQEGLLNFALGAFGGVGHTIVLDNLPIHKITDYSGKKDENEKYPTKIVSSRTKDSLGRKQYFENIKDALIKDINWYTDKNKELDKAIATNDQLKASQLRQEMLTVQSLNSVMTGTTDAWRQEYKNISALDNTKDMGDQVREQLGQLDQQLQQSQDPEEQTAIQQQIDETTKYLQKVDGKTEAMVRGFARDQSDNKYKQTAQRSIQDLDYLQDLYDNLRINYYTGEPYTDDLVQGIFARTAEQHFNKRLIEEEDAAITKDEVMMNSLGTYNGRIEVANRVAKDLETDRKNILEAAEQNNLPELKRLAGKYGIVANKDSEVSSAVKKLVDKLSARIDAHKKSVDDAKALVETETGYSQWKEKFPGKSMKQYLEYLAEEQPLDARFTQRRVNVEKAREEWNIAQQGLEELKSVRGIQNFLSAVAQHLAGYKARIELKNINDRAELFKRINDKKAAAKLSREQKEIARKLLHDELKSNITESNRIKAEIEVLQKEYDRLDNTRGIRNNIKKRKVLDQINQLKSQLDNLTQQREVINRQLENINQDIVKAETDETASDNITRDDVSDETVEVENAVAVRDSQTTNQPDNQVIVQQDNQIDTQNQPPKDEEQVDPYIALVDQVPGEVHDILDNLYIMEKGIMESGKPYSYDLAKAAMQPLIDDQILNAESVHDIIIKQKDYLTEEFANKPKITDTTQETVPTPLDMPDVSANDITSPSEPSVPVISGVIDFDRIREDDIAQHVSDKTHNGLKNNTATIEYMQIEKKGGRTIHDGKVVEVTHFKYLPMYQRLDQKANHNTLRYTRKGDNIQAVIKEGDEIEFRVDTEFNGEIAFDHTSTQDDFGYPKQRPDKFSNHITENGKIIMNSESDGFANVPIQMIHVKSGEVIGYLPRTDWITAKYPGAVNWRNIEDNILMPDGRILTGNVETQRVYMISVRKTIAQAFNADKGQVIKSNVTERTSSGHIFYNTDINTTQETYKLDPLLAKNLLFDPDLLFGITRLGTVNIAEGVELSGEKNFTRESLLKMFGGEVDGVPVVILPMPNGRWSVSPLRTRQLKQRPADINTVAKAIEVYLAAGTEAQTEEHTKIIEGIKEATTHNGTGRGLDITDEKDLELFISQYFSHTTRFGEVHTRADGKVLPGKKKQTKFLIDIPPRLSNEKKSRIKIGRTFSGESPMYASLIDGHLNLDFRDTLEEGLGTRYKNITYTRGDIRGINDKRLFNSVIIRTDGVVVTTPHKNYNEYLKSFADTIVYGKHRIDKDGKEVENPSKPGTYVYGANPVINFDINPILQTRIIQDGDSGVPLVDGPASKKDKLDITDLLLSGALKPHSSTAVINQVGTIEDSVPATIDNLINLQTRTPVANRNEKSPRQALDEMHSLGITEIAPNFNPFLKCS